MKKITEREIAVGILSEILDKKGYNNIVLRRTLEKNADLTRSQRAFITMTINGVIRNLIYIDYVLNSFSKTPTGKMDTFILNDLRSAVFQLLFLSGAPDFAVCNEAVNMTKTNGYARLSGFVNGILRSILRNKDNIALPDKEKNPVEYLSVKYSYPEWMIDNFTGLFGITETVKMLEANMLPPSISVCANTLKTTPALLKAELEGEGVVVGETRILKQITTVTGTSDMTGLGTFKNGLFHVIDESSALAVKALDPTPGSVVLDLCSAPGGKAVLMSQLMQNTGKITACDIHGHKAELIKQTAERLGCDNIETVISDATVINEKYIGAADFVLVDAPCSGLGLVGKKPDIKYTKAKGDIAALAKLQREILETAANYVKPGGVLLYSTCTLTAEENRGNAEWFLEKFGFEKCELDEFAAEHELPEQAVAGGFITILPHYFGTDGFFISKFKKRRVNN